MGDNVVLTDPVIMSRRKVYGPTDLGPEGISTFFSRHECNEFCESNWTRPRDQRSHLKVRQGTTMSVGPQHYGRAVDRLQSFQEDDEDEDEYEGFSAA
jgi:hypothetical protein